MSAGPYDSPDTADKNRIYDTVGDEVWQLAVYEPVHAGWEFTNIAGAPLLDAAAAALGLSADSHVLELCSGTGAVSRYLNQRHGCAVTGIEVNANQLAHARRARADAGTTAARVCFVQGDVTSWQPDRLYDAAFIIDSLSLLSDPLAALRSARRALWSGGWLVFADTAEGPAMTAETAARVWELDGLRPLPSESATAELLLTAGLSEIHLTDTTEAAVVCFAAIAHSLRVHATKIIELVGADELAHWRESTDFYLDAYASGQLTYRRGVARRPRRSGPGIAPAMPGRRGV